MNQKQKNFLVKIAELKINMINNLAEIYDYIEDYKFRQIKSDLYHIKIGSDKSIENILESIEIELKTLIESNMILLSI